MIDDDNLDFTFRYPYSELLIWAVLTKRQELAMLMWRHGEEALAKSLIASARKKNVVDLSVPLADDLPTGPLASVAFTMGLAPANNVTGAFTAPTTRFPAAITLAVTAAGTPALGIGAAFWGLIAGLAFHLLERWKERGLSAPS